MKNIIRRLTFTVFIVPFLFTVGTCVYIFCIPYWIFTGKNFFRYIDKASFVADFCEWGTK